MAKYILAASSDRPRGSLQGSTFQACGKVFAIRKRNVPIQKRSIRQSRAKNAFEAQAGRWRTYTAGQKNSWDTNAPLYPRTDSLGNTYNQTGQQMSLGANQKRLYMQIAATATTGAPISFTALFGITTGAQFTPQSMFFNFANLTVETGFNVNVYCTPPVNRGVDPSKVVKNFIGTRSQGNTFAGKNWWSDYNLVFPIKSTMVGQVIYYTIENVQRNSGQVRQVVTGSQEITLF